jgi:hypothetical protein
LNTADSSAKSVLSPTASTAPKSSSVAAMVVLSAASWPIWSAMPLPVVVANRL